MLVEAVPLAPWLVWLKSWQGTTTAGRLASEEAEAPVLGLSSGAAEAVVPAVDLGGAAAGE